MSWPLTTTLKLFTRLKSPTSTALPSANSKDKIAQVETQVKDAKKANIIQYFNELCQAEGIDFLSFDQLKLDINLSTTEKAYKEQINAFVLKISDDIELIKTQAHEAEIMVAYKATLNASKAIKDVNDRKEKERLEAERIKIVETNRRSSFRRMNFNHSSRRQRQRWFF